MTYQHSISRIIRSKKKSGERVRTLCTCVWYAFEMGDYKRSYISDLLSHRLTILGASCQEILPISLSVLQLLQSTLLTMKPGPWFCLCQTLEQTEECEAGISWSHTHYNCKAKSLAQGLKKSLASLRQWEAESRTCPLQFAIPGLLRQIQLLCRRIAISKA